jgi:carbon monoxide dehydrogenase subunit G
VEKILSDAPANSDSPAAPHKHRHFPFIFLGIIVLLIAAAAVRGTWADSAPKNPASSAEGIVTQLYSSEGHKEVRCAMVVDRPAADVWKTVTDYEHFSEIFPLLKSSRSEREANGRCHLIGTVTSILGDYTFEVHVDHSQSPEKSMAYWDHPSGAVSVDRGNWTVIPAGPDKTLVSYSLEAEVSPYPAFLVRNVLLSGQKKVLIALDAWLKKKQ